MLRVNEIFGPTIQGEGTTAGRHCLFVRVADCNLECKWCDTPYTWAFTKEKAAKHDSGTRHDKLLNSIEMSTADIMDALLENWMIYSQPTIVVISGGEPLMQQPGLAELLQELKELKHETHIETAGTIQPSEILDQHVTQYNVSPKLTNSGNRLAKRYKQDVLNWFSDSVKAWFKFVVTHPEDLDEVRDIVNMSEIDPRRVMVMPEGTTIDRNVEVGRKVIDEALQLGYGLSFRSHVLLWGDGRGK
jgi:organic radical activating enzyme